MGFSENLNPSIHNRGGIQSVYKQPAAREISSKSLLTLSSTAAAKALASSKSAGQMRGPSLATHCIGLLTISDSCARVGDSGARPIGSLYHNVHGWTGALTCEKESEVRSENDSEEEETYLVSDGSALVTVPAASAGRADVSGRKSERRARSEAITTARRRRLT